MTEIARLRIQPDEVRPQVMRPIEVPLAMRLDDPHLAIQIAMGWDATGVERRLDRRPLLCAPRCVEAELRWWAEPEVGGAVLGPAAVAVALDHGPGHRLRRQAKGEVAALLRIVRLSHAGEASRTRSVQTAPSAPSLTKRASSLTVSSGARSGRVTSETRNGSRSGTRNRPP